MVTVYIASFNRASDGALEHLQKELKKKEMLVHDPFYADYILAVGDRTETFDFVLKWWRINKKIIHLWAGEISQGTHDEVYRHAMTMMSDVQLCTDDTAVFRVESLCSSIDKKPNAHVVGNVFADDLTVKEELPDEKYVLVLYNPPTRLSKEEIQKEIDTISETVKQLNLDIVWIEPNGDYQSELLEPYFNAYNFDRPKFLGLLKNCEYFITNSSCQYYEAPFFLAPEQIISIGERNKDRETKYADVTKTGATEKIIKILEGLK